MKHSPLAWLLLVGAVAGFLAAGFSYLDGDPYAGREHLAIALLLLLLADTTDREDEE